MAIPLKTGADLYNNELLRARLHNHPADALDEYGVGSFYFNNSSGLNSSNRMRYRGLTAWHSVANLEDIEDVKDLIKALSGSSSESVASVLGKVITLEGYFSNGKAKDADLLDGHNSDYFATASGLNALQEKVSAFLDGEADSDAVLENLKEIQAFLNSYDGATSLADMFGAVNTQIADRYTKAEADARYLQLTGGIVANTSNAPLKIKTDSESAWVGIEYLNNLGEREGSVGVYGGKPIFVPAALDKIWTILHSGNYSDLITDLNKNLNVPSITIGGIKLSVVDGQLQIDGDAFATGQFASGGIGSEGSGSGASGIVILEDWEKYDDTLAQVLGAGLGVGLRDKIAALESKATNVSVAQTLTSGKEIGAITIDGVATKLYAPSTYAWSEITSKPISLGGYGIIDAVRLLSSQQGNYAIKTHLPAVLVGYNGEEKEGINGDYGILNIPVWSANTESSYYATQIYSAPNGANLTWRQVTASTNGAWKRLLDESNYESIVGNKFLKLSGGTLTDSVMVNHSSGSKGYLLLTNGASIGGLVTNGTAVELFNVNGYGIGVEGTSDVYVLTNWAKKTLLHAGNVGDYKAGGLVAIDSRNKNYAPYSNEFTKKALTSHFERALSIGYGANDYYVSMLHISPWSEESGGPEHQLAFRHDGAIGHRYGSEVWSNWRTLAFIDSNVASATKLQTARTIWGQSFDGTANVDGKIYQNGKWVFGLHADNNLFIGYDSKDTGSTQIFGKSIDFYNSIGDLTMLINSSGNVTIGSSDLASVNYRLYISGGLTRINSGLQVKGHTSFFAEANDAYVTSFYTNGSGLTIQPRIEDVGYTDIFLNPSGGNVGIGTTSSVYKLNVNGSIGLAGQIISQYEGTDAWRIVATSSTQVYIQGGVGGNIAITGMNAAELGEISLYAKTVAPQYGNSTVLGAYNRRWLNVISEMGNFSSRLLVGGATDDGTTALQVNGDIALRRGVSSTIGAPYDANNPTIYNRIIFDGATYGIRYYSGGWTSSVVDSHTFYVGLNNDAALIIKNNKDVHISGNLIVDGQVSSGGVAEAGTGGVGGSTLDRLVFEIPKDSTSFSCEHNLGTRDISVTIYEKGNDFQQVLADVYLDSTNVARIVFGSATDVAHKVVIIG